MSEQDPYITVTAEPEEKRAYNPEYGSDRLCGCGHVYYRHFDTYEGMEPVGCKYCQCYEFKEAKGLLTTALAGDNVESAKAIKDAHAKLTRLGEPIIGGTLQHKGYNGRDVESVLVSKDWLDRYIKFRKLLLEGEPEPPNPWTIEPGSEYLSWTHTDGRTMTVNRYGKPNLRIYGTERKMIKEQALGTGPTDDETIVALVEAVQQEMSDE
ncbi:hypothetical protein N9917_00165 [Deltaproteobacteria bacterium]|nr:hypothetical protein [Deltaproteobacteria bacterium]